MNKRCWVNFFRVVGAVVLCVALFGSNWNIISNNNCRHCSTPIDINGANTVDDNNLGTVS